MTSSSNNSIFPILRALNSLAIMTVAMSGMYASVMVLEPATREFDIGRGAGALPYTMYMVGFGLGNIILGKWADRTGIAVLALLAAFSLPTGLYLASMAEGLWPFVMILALLCGFLGGAFAFGPLVADISKWFDRRRGLAVGIVISGSYVAGALWPPLLQAWFDEYGWRQSFVYLAMVCAVTMLPLSLIYFRKTSGAENNSPEKDSTAWDRPLGLSTGQLQCTLCFAGIGCCVAMAMPQIHIVPHAIDLGFEARDGANMLALMLGFGIISRISSGWISDKIGGVKTLLLGSVLQGLVIFSFLFIDTLTGLYAVSIAFGLSQGGIVPSYTLIIRRFFPADEAGSRIGLVFVSTIGGMALGGWMAGILYDITGSYTVSFINAIAFNAMNFGIAVFIQMKSNRQAGLTSS
jgi:MFS family permease